MSQEVKDDSKSNKDVKDDNKSNKDVKENDDDEKGLDKVKVLILGGCGFIGRHLLQYLISGRKCSSIRVADKLLPQTSYMTEEMAKLYQNPIVKMVQSDLSKDAHIKKVFDEEFDYIINLCGETRFGQGNSDYKMKCVDTAKKCIEAASLSKKLKKWVEISTAQIYEPRKEPAHKEDSTIAPFTRLAEHRYEVEKLLQKSKLPYVILRPSIVYGPGDKTGLTPRLVCAVCYKFSQEKMNFLWTKGVRINTVHVRDVCHAIWIACTQMKQGSIYNLSDLHDFTQGDLNTILESIFKIECGFQNAAMNKAASAFMAQAAQASNDKHVPMWSSVCKKYDIASTTPLTPFIDEEILTKNHLAVDGTKIEKETEFRYQYPKVKEEYLVEIIDEYVAQGYFPDLKKF